MEVSNNESGQSIFEIVIAIGLISLVLIAMVAAASVSVISATYARNQTQAGRLTQEAAEWIRGEKDADWAGFKTNASIGTWCLIDTTWSQQGSCGADDLVSGTKFSRQVTFTPAGGSYVKADISTTWKDAKGTHSVPTTAVFTNW
jgi:Tfp pilus assembly protein PilV